MSKPRESTSKETKSRDLKGIFVKTVEKIPPDLFGGKNTPPTHPTKRYTSSKSREGQNSTTERTQSLADIQFELTVEQLVSSPQHSGPVIEQLNPLNETTSFPEIQEERAIIPFRKEGIPTFTYPFKTREKSLREPYLKLIPLVYQEIWQMRRKDLEWRTKTDQKMMNKHLDSPS